jgi:GT2 family glycosyltransferase
VSPRVCAILVNYNAGRDLRLALESIAGEMRGRDWEAVVVDNASTDGSEAIAGEFAPHVRLIRNEQNVGFARGVNQGLRSTAAPLVLVMNPDCRVAAGALAVLEAELESHHRCAIVAPRILNPDGSSQGNARGDPDMFTGLFGRASALRRWFPELAVSKRNVIHDDPSLDERSVVVDWLSGACMLARRDAIAAVGGLDDRYFMYWEDADLCRRLRAKGYEVRYVPAVTATHRVGHSSRTARESSIRAFHESAYLYYTTHVARRPFDPRRPIGRFLLGARCYMQLRKSKVKSQRSNSATSAAT